MPKLRRGGSLSSRPLLLSTSTTPPPPERPSPPTSAAAAADPRHERGVVAVVVVSVELEPVVEQPLDVVERVRTVGVPRELDGAPDLLVARLGDDPVELPLEPLELAGELGSAQQRQAPQTAQLLAEPQ